MIPVNQFILGGGTLYYYLVKKMTNSIDEQIAFLQSQKQAINEAYRRNAQYHDYCKLFDSWFGSNIDNKVFESAITFWFKDVDFDGDKVWEYFHMNN